MGLEKIESSGGLEEEDLSLGENKALLVANKTTWKEERRD